MTFNSAAEAAADAGADTGALDPNLSLEAFLAAPASAVASVAPASMIYSVSGTRRGAAIAGKFKRGDEYVQWSRERMMACLDLIFAHGVRHVIMPLINPSQFMEATPAYRENLWDWLEQGLAGAEALAAYRRRGWGVRLPFAENLPRLREAGAAIERETGDGRDAEGESKKYLWVFIIPEHNFLWRQALARLSQSRANSTAEAIRLLYGADIPPATLYLDFGKPVVSPDLAPPYLMGVLHCYWTQRPGYSLDERQLRTILYDYAFTRPTWKADKRGRAELALEHEELWRQDLIIGLGTRVGPFWYPAASPSPGDEV